MKMPDTIKLIYVKGKTEDYWREDYPHSAKESVEYVRKDTVKYVIPECEFGSIWIADVDGFVPYEWSEK